MRKEQWIYGADGGIKDGEIIGKDWQYRFRSEKWQPAKSYAGRKIDNLAGNPTWWNAFWRKPKP